MIPIGVPANMIYRLRGRRPPPVVAAPDVADADVDRVLASQWPGAPLGLEAGWPGLARAMLACAVLDAGVAPQRGYVDALMARRAARGRLSRYGTHPQKGQHSP